MIFPRRTILQSYQFLPIPTYSIVGAAVGNEFEFSYITINLYFSIWIKFHFQNKLTSELTTIVNRT